MMIKKLLILSLLSFGLNAYAGTPPTSIQEPGYIVTPTLATGVFTTQRFATDQKGNLVICPDIAEYVSYSNACRLEGRTAWVRIENFPPAGKKYVGFRLINLPYKERALEIYWK